MKATIQKIADDLMNLPPGDRVELADALYGSVEESVDSEVEHAWDTEIGRRVADYAAGKTHLIPANEVHAAIRRTLDEARRLSAGGKP